jgi:hypothetical protein
MISTNLAIARLRRDLTLGSLVNASLLVGVFLCVLLGAAFDSRFGDLVLLLLLGVVWITLSYRSMRGSRLAAGSPSLIAAGQFDLAEYQIEQALRTFSLFRTSKLLSLHHLAVLRHAQRRWADAVVLCQALLHQRLGGLKSLSRQSRLILADSLLELGDLRGVYDAISGLYTQRLSLAEAMKLLTVQLDYLSRVHAWEPMLEGVGTKVQLAELMNTPASARSQALLALAAAKAGRGDLSTWLRRRAELLISDPAELARERPVLSELWPPSSSPSSSSSSAGDVPAGPANATAAAAAIRAADDSPNAPQLDEAN